MTVAELMEALKDYDADATVYIGIDGEKYDVDAVQHFRGYAWETVGRGVVIVVH